MEMDGVVQRRPPVMRLAFHAQALRHAPDLYAAGDPADVVDDKPYLIHRAAANVLRIVVRREDKFSNRYREVQSLGQLHKTVNIARWYRVFVRHAVQFIEYPADLSRFVSRVCAYAVEEERETIASGLSHGLRNFYVEPVIHGVIDQPKVDESCRR